MLRFIRSYYLYIYFWMSESQKLKSGKTNKSLGFMMLSVLILPIQLLVVIIVSTSIEPSIGQYFTSLQRTILFGTHRGDLTGAVGMMIGVSTMLTYFICCVGVKYEDIQARLATHGEWLAHWSFTRIAVVLVFNVVMVFLSLIISNEMGAYK